MHRTVKLPYTADPSFAGVLAELRRRQSRAIRTAYCRLVDGMPLKNLYRTLRGHPVGQGMHTSLLLSGISKANSLYRLRPDGKVVFGGRKSLMKRSWGKMTDSEWRERRLSPLTVEGHAKSFGPQGGNQLVTLDARQSQVIFHGPEGKDHVLVLKLSRRSRPYRRRLEQLQARCEILRDVPFSVSLTGTEISISWAARGQTPAPVIGPPRILSLDLNPNRIGWTVVEAKAKGSCCVAWGIFEYPELNRRLKVASADPRAVAQNHKRAHELSILAKRVAVIARRYGAQTLVTEHLNFPAGDHGRGRRFNRLLNQCWLERGFLQPLRRRTEEMGLRSAQVSAAYSSRIGNLMWADSLQIPDPACAALEIGRRFLDPLPFTPDTREPPSKSNADRLWKDGRRAAKQSAALSGWKRVWSHLNPLARDTPRQAWRRRRRFLPSRLLRRLSVREQRSQVLDFDPRAGRSDVFAIEFNRLITG